MNKRGDSKVESNDSPEIPDRGETSDIPGLPSGGTDQKQIKKRGFLPLCNTELNTAMWGLPSMGKSGGGVQGLYLMKVL